MNKRMLDHSVNIIAYEKNDTKYAMCCAWSMMVDYDKVLSLLGFQSVTGKNLSKGDRVGFSCLSQGQKNIAEALGDRHSNEVDKLDGIDYKNDNGAIVVLGAMTNCVCEVIDILHLEGIEEDNLLYLKVLSCEENDLAPLHMSDF